MSMAQYTYAGMPLERTGLIAGEDSYWAFVIDEQDFIARSCHTKDPGKAFLAYQTFWQDYCDKQ